MKRIQRYYLTHTRLCSHQQAQVRLRVHRCMCRWIVELPVAVIGSWRVRTREWVSWKPGWVYRYAHHVLVLSSSTSSTSANFGRCCVHQSMLSNQVTMSDATALFKSRVDLLLLRVPPRHLSHSLLCLLCSYQLSVKLLFWHATPTNFWKVI